MKNRERAEQSSQSYLYMRVALITWIGVLAILAYRSGREPFALPMAGLRSGRALLQLGRTLVASGLVSFATYVPLGFLSVLALRDRDSWRDRVLHVGLPSIGASLSLAIGINFLRSPALRAPDLLFLILPWLGCLIGWWAGLAWRRGRTARILFLPQLAFVAMLLAAVLGIIAYRALETSPLEMQVPKVTSAEKRRLYSLFSGKNPLKLEEGKTVEVSLTSEDINLLLAWGLPLADTARAATVEIEPGRGRLLASVQLPGTSKLLNVAAQGAFGFSAGQLRLQPERLRVGAVEVPARLLAAFAPTLARIVMEDERVKPMVTAVRSIELTHGAVTVRYGYGRPPKGFVASLFREDGAAPMDVAGIRAQLLNLLAAKTSISGTNDERFAKAVQAAFRFAKEHSSGERAVAANRDAVLALGIALGHPRVESLIGSFLDEDTRVALRSNFSGTTLRSREDWPKHFFVSAALTIVAAGNVSDATGLFKEEKDADGGSGFSFADLLADRSGTTFAQIATRNEASARALQVRLADGFNVDDYLPSADGLPEGLQDAEFQRQMGGVGGPGYNRLVAEIERRVSGCSAYR